MFSQRTWPQTFVGKHGTADDALRLLQTVLVYDAREAKVLVIIGPFPFLGSHDVRY